jgi:hypothetical protein
MISMISEVKSFEQQVTTQPRGHVLTNINVWSPDSKWIIYDTRSDPAGEKFDASTIEMVNVETLEVREIYHSQNGAHCGVATFSPTKNCAAFILGPEHPTSDWQYSAWHRQGVLVDVDKPNVAIPLDARDITPPFTPGALRGGSHVHIFHPAGDWLSFTYDDHILAAINVRPEVPHVQLNQRNVGVSALGHPVHVSKDHSRNNDGVAFSVLATQTVNQPRPGSDEISRACEEGWVGTNGYMRRDGSRQRRALAFQGTVVSSKGDPLTEVFLVDLPNDLTHASHRPLEGNATTRPAPPRDTRQRRLTYTMNRKYPGLQGVRHWLRSSPDGSRIVFLMRDDTGVVQIWTIPPNGGEPQQFTALPFDVASAFTWSPQGDRIAYIADNSVFTTRLDSGESVRLTERTDSATAPRPEACVFSPDGKRIAYVRRVTVGDAFFNQVFVVAIS